MRDLSLTHLTDIWAVTHRNEVPYAYVRGTNWEQAMANASAHPQVIKHSQIDGGYAIHRLPTTEVMAYLTRTAAFSNNTQLSTFTKVITLNAYLTDPDVNPQMPDALYDLRNLGYLPLPSLETTHQTPSKANKVRVIPCPERHLGNPTWWATEMLAHNPTTAYKPLYFTCAEVLDIAEMTLERA